MSVRPHSRIAPEDCLVTGREDVQLQGQWSHTVLLKASYTPHACVLLLLLSPYRGSCSPADGAQVPGKVWTSPSLLLYKARAQRLARSKACVVSVECLGQTLLPGSFFTSPLAPFADTAPSESHLLQVKFRPSETVARQCMALCGPASEGAVAGTGGGSLSVAA